MAEPVEPSAQQALAEQIRTARGSLRRLAEVRGLAGGHRAPARTVTLRARDGVRLAGSFLPGPAVDAPAVLLAHGFAAHGRKPAYALLADVLAGHCHVLSLDLRGHGRSGGECTLGGDERLDVQTGVRWLRATGMDAVVPIGVSMGGTSVLHAFDEGLEVDAAVVVSTPAWLGHVATNPMRDLDRMWRSGWRRRGFGLLSGVRLVPPERWQPFADPVDLAGKVETPLLVVHGNDDHYFAIDHAEALRDAAAGPATLWRMPRFGHAEDGFVPAFATALATAIVATLETGHFPEG